MIIALLPIFINLEHIESRIKTIIIREMESEFFPNDNDQTNYFQLILIEQSFDNNHNNNIPEEIRGILLDERNEKFDSIKQKVKNILIANSINDYLVMSDPQLPTELIVLERSKAESLGEVHCRHCGMEFEDQIQLGNHLRIHYLI